MRSIYSFLLMICFISACSGGNDKKEVTKPIEPPEKIVDPSPNIMIPDNRFANNYQVLLFGNSHVVGLSSLLKKLLIAGNPSATIKIQSAGGGFLDNQTTQQRRVDLLENEPWTHVILQGQKHSQSGATTYPITAAITWIKKAKSYDITPILFPEHPQQGKTQEGRRVHQIHTEIAALQKSCVAPVGLTWDKVIMTVPQLILHTTDGNHASLTGQLLTAFVFYEVITGEAADLLPFIDDISVDEATQQIMRQLASETIQAHQACLFEA